MKLVKFDNYKIVVEPELLLLTPFKIIYKQDKTRDKEKFYEFLTILYYTYDPRSDYSYIIDDMERLSEVLITNGFKRGLEFTKEEGNCVELYKKLTTTLSQEVLKSTKIAIDKLRKYLEDIDLSERTDKGAVVYQPSAITSTIKQLLPLTKEIIETEKLVAKEILEKGRARGGNEKKKIFEDGFDNMFK